MFSFFFKLTLSCFQSRLSGTEPGKASPEARKRSRLCDSPSESSQTRRPILPIVAGSVGATGTVASTPNSGRQLNAAGANGKMMNIPSEMSCFPGGNESPPGDSNERGQLVVREGVFACCCFSILHIDLTFLTIFYFVFILHNLLIIMIARGLHIETTHWVMKFWLYEKTLN